MIVSEIKVCDFLTMTATNYIKAASRVSGVNLSFFIVHSFKVDLKSLLFIFIALVYVMFLLLFILLVDFKVASGGGFFFIFCIKTYME